MVSLEEVANVLENVFGILVRTVGVLAMTVLVGTIIIFPCWGLNEAGLVKWQKIPAQSVFRFLLIFAILPYALLSRLDYLYDWHAFPLNFALTITPLAIYAKVYPEPIERLEGFFHRHGWRQTLAVINTIAKLSTSREEMQKEEDFISETRCLEAEQMRFAQYHGVLTRTLTEQRAAGPSDASTADYAKRSAKLRQLIDEVLRNWGAVNEQRRQLWQTRPGGAWIREETRKTPGDLYEEGKQACKRFVGCCAYSCGCCQKTGHFSLQSMSSHCSDWCECCCERKGDVINLDLVD